MSKIRNHFISMMVCGIFLLSGTSRFFQLNAEESPATPDSNASQSVLSSEDETFMADLTAACDKAAESFESEYDLKSATDLKMRARLETKNLIYFLNRYPDQDRAKGWMDYLFLNDLVEALSPQADDMDTIEDSMARFEKKEKGLDMDCFTRVRDILRDYIKTYEREKTGNPKEDFAFYCESVKESVQTLLTNPTCAESSEMVTASLDYLNEYQPDSPTVHAILDLIHKRFSSPNVEIVVGSEVVFPEKGEVITKPTLVQEIIRGTPTYGHGTVTGTLHPKFVPNEKVAEIRLVLDAKIATNTTAVSQGVTILSSSNGHVVVTKPIYLDKSLDFGPAASSSDLNSVITGVNTGRGPIGSKVVYDRINQEYPYSKAESQGRMEKKVVAEFDNQINQFLAQRNYFNQTMEFLKKNHYEPKIWSWTTDSVLAWNAQVGNDRQLGPVQKRENETSDHSLLVKINQSAFNNPFYTFLAGRRLSEQDLKKELKESFHLDLDSRVKKDSSADSEDQSVSCDEIADFYITFYKELPLVVLFKENKIIVQARIDLFEQDEKTFPGLDIEVVYQAEKRDNDYVLVRGKTEAWPPELDPEAVVPARFQVIRSQVLKRLNDTLPSEIPLKAIPLLASLPTSDKDVSPEVRGVLNVEEFSLDNGWLVLGADYLPTK